MITRDDAVRLLDEQHAELAALFAELDEDAFVRRGTIGGGDWSAKDLLGHLATWEAFALDAVSEWRQGRKPYIAGLLDGGIVGIDHVNALTVADKASLTWDEVRAGAEGTHAALVRLIGEMSDDEWNAKALYPAERRDHLGSLVGSVLGAPKRPFGHAFAHIPDLQTYVSSLA